MSDDVSKTTNPRALKGWLGSYRPPSYGAKATTAVSLKPLPSRSSPARRDAWSRPSSRSAATGGCCAASATRSTPGCGRNT